MIPSFYQINTKQFCFLSATWRRARHLKLCLQLMKTWLKFPNQPKKLLWNLSTNWVSKNLENQNKTWAAFLIRLKKNNSVIMNNCWYRPGHVSLLATLGLRSSNLRRIPGLTYRQMASGKSWVRETSNFYTIWGCSNEYILDYLCFHHFSDAIH